MQFLRRYFFKLLLFIIITILSVSAYANIPNTFRLMSSAFEDHGVIPNAYSALHKGVSPPLNWEGAPENARSYVLIMISSTQKLNHRYHPLYDHRGAPQCEKVYWVAYNIPASMRGIQSGTQEIKMGKNSFGQTRYQGLSVQLKQPQYYQFYLLALDIPKLNVPKSSNAHDILYAARDHIIAKAQLEGRY